MLFYPAAKRTRTSSLFENLWHPPHFFLNSFIINCQECIMIVSPTAHVAIFIFLNNSYYTQVENYTFPTTIQKKKTIFEIYSYLRNECEKIFFGYEGICANVPNTSSRIDVRTIFFETNIMSDWS
jgi:hypothetical protein